MLEKLGDFFNQDPQRQQDYQDFERRYRENPDQLSDEEAARRCGSASAAPSPNATARRLGTTAALTKVTRTTKT